MKGVLCAPLAAAPLLPFTAIIPYILMRGAELHLAAAIRVKPDVSVFEPLVATPLIADVYQSDPVVLRTEVDIFAAIHAK